MFGKSVATAANKPNTDTEMTENHKQKLNEIKTGNGILNENISTVMTSMKDSIKSDVSDIYDKIHKDTAERLEKYNKSINALERRSRRFWGITDMKEALFWCMCLAILLLIGKDTLDIYGINLPVVTWQIAYPCSFIPLFGYAIRVIAEKINDRN